MSALGVRRTPCSEMQAFKPSISVRFGGDNRQWTTENIGISESPFLDPCGAFLSKSRSESLRGNNRGLGSTRTSGNILKRKFS